MALKFSDTFSHQKMLEKADFSIFSQEMTELMNKLLAFKYNKAIYWIPILGLFWFTMDFSKVLLPNNTGMYNQLPQQSVVESYLYSKISRTINAFFIFSILFFAISFVINLLVFYQQWIVHFVIYNEIKKSKKPVKN